MCERADGVRFECVRSKYQNLSCTVHEPQTTTHLWFPYSTSLLNDVLADVTVLAVSFLTVVVSMDYRK